MKKGILLLIIFTSLFHLSFGQDKRIDKLEVLYSQGHYTKVLRKANKLLAIPDYDYSGMPSFYKSLSLFRLMESKDWLERHKNTLNEAIANYNTFLTYKKVDAYVKSHYFEIAELKQILISLEKQYRKTDRKKSALLKQFIDKQLKGVTPRGVKTLSKPKQEKKGKNEKTNGPSHQKQKANPEKELREAVVSYAMQYIGTPYSWAGTSPKGFDCSGYTGYVLNNFGVKIPRSASAQKEHALKISEKQANKGDLVFFRTGNKITHVGIVISEPGESLKMIHASSSKGIITTDIKSSTYWYPKLAGVGKVIYSEE